MMNLTTRHARSVHSFFFINTLIFIFLIQFLGVLSVEAASTTTIVAYDVRTPFKNAAQIVTLHANVTYTDGNADGGTMTFQVLNAGANVGSAASSAVTNGFVSASYSLPAGQQTGTYTIQMTYSGNANFASSNDASKVLTITPHTYSYTNGLGFGLDVNGNTWNIWSANGSNIWDWQQNYVGGYLHYSFKVLDYNGFYCGGSCRFHNVWSKNPNLGFEISDVVRHDSVFPESNENDHKYQVDIQWNGQGYHASVYDITGNIQASNQDFAYTVNANMYDSWTWGTSYWSNAIDYNDETPSAHALQWTGTVYQDTPTGTTGGGGDIRTDALPVMFLGNTASTTIAFNLTIPFKASAQNATLTANVAVSGQPVNEGKVTFQIYNGSATVGNAVTSTTVANGNASVSYPLPAGLAVGTYTIQATYSGSVNFATSSDNTKTLTVTATPTLADLIPKNLILTNITAAPGDNITVNLTMLNQGGTNAPASSTQVRINQASARPIPMTGVLADFSTPAIAAGASAPLSIPIQIPPGLAAGTYYIWILADNTSQVAQSDPNNDFANIAITVTAVPNNAPALQSISPATIAAGSAGFAMTLAGSNFNANSIITWSGQADIAALKTQSATRITVDIPASYVATAGSASIAVFNPGIGEGTSSPQMFTITSGPSPIAPNFTSPSHYASPVRQPFVYIITATGTQPIVFSFDANTLPAGLVLSGDTISGTPTAVGPTIVHIIAVNGTKPDAEMDLSIEITEPTLTSPPIKLTNATNGNAIVQEGGQVSISSIPAMPDLTATLSGISVPAQTMLNWNLTIEYDWTEIKSIDYSEVPHHDVINIPVRGSKKLRMDTPWSILKDLKGVSLVQNQI